MQNSANTPNNPAPQHPTREQLLNAVEFLKKQYQGLAIELAQKSHLLQQLQSNPQSQSPGGSGGFEMQMQNYELRSQLNQQKIAHLEQLKKITHTHHKEMEDLQNHLQIKLQKEREQHMMRLREIETSNLEPADGRMLGVLREKVQQSEEMINRLHREFEGQMQGRLQEIAGLVGELERVRQERIAEKEHFEGNINHLMEIVEQQRRQLQEGGGEFRKRHEEHIAILENQIAQLANTLLEYKKRQEQLRSEVNYQTGEELNVVIQTQKLNAHLAQLLHSCSTRLQVLLSHPQKSTEQVTQLSSEMLKSTHINEQLGKNLKICERHMEQLRRSRPHHDQRLEQQLKHQGEIIQRQRQQIQELVKKLEMVTIEKEQEIERSVRQVVEKYEQKGRSQGRNEEGVKATADTTAKVAEKEHEIRELQHRLQDQDNKIREYQDEKDELIDRIKELEVEVLGMTEKIKEVSHKQQNQSQRSDLFEELERLKEQNNQYRQKFSFLQKQAKRIVLEHEQTIQRLEIELIEVNEFNQQLKQEQEIFKREYQTIVKEKQAVEQGMRQMAQQHQQQKGNKDAGVLPIKTPSANNSRIEDTQRIKSQLERNKSELEKIKTELESSKSLLIENDKAKRAMEDKNKQNTDMIELYNQRLELLKMDKKKSDTLAQQNQAKAKELDKKCSLLQTNSKKMQQKIADLSQQILHKKNQNDKLLQRYEQIRHHHQQQITTLHQQFQQMNETLIREKRDYEFKNQAMIAEQSQQYQRIEGELAKFKEENLRHKEELVRVNKEKLEMFNQMTKARTNSSHLEQEIQSREKVIRSLEQRISSVNNQMNQFKQSPAQQQSSIIIAYKDRVYEYIMELQQKCRLLQGLNSIKTSSNVENINTQSGISPTPVTMVLKDTLERSNIVLDNDRLRTQNKELQEQLHQMRLQVKNISIEFEKYKRNSIKDLYQGKMIHAGGADLNIKAYCKEIQRLNAVLMAKQQQINSFRHATAVRPISPVRLQPPTIAARSPTHVLAPMTTSVTTTTKHLKPTPAPIPSPLNFNALVDCQSQSAVSYQQMPVRDSSRVVTVRRYSPPPSFLDQSNATASFRRP